MNRQTLAFEKSLLAKTKEVDETRGQVRQTQSNSEHF